MKLAKCKGLGIWILIAVILAGCFYALHDMQTAEGVGLYFSMQLGLEQRLFLDLTVDVLGIIALAILVYLPCKILGHNTKEAYLRLLIAYLAAVPQASMARLLALFQQEQEFLWNLGLGEGVRIWIYSIAPFLQVWIPLLILLYGIGVVKQCLSMKSWYWRVGISQGILLVILFMVPSAENVILYLVGYLVLLIAFDCWEAVLQKLPTVKKWSVLFWALLLLRGIYRIVVLMSQF